MRGLALIVLVVVGTSSIALAKPKAAVLPVSGDGGDKVTLVLIDALGDTTTVVTARDVEKAMGKLDLSGELDAKDVKKLQKKLGTAVVVQGKVEKAGKKRTLTLGVFVRGKKPTELTLQYKSATSDKFRDDLKELVQQIAVGDAGDEEEDKPKRKPDEDKPKRKPDEVATSDEDSPRKRRRKKGDADEVDATKAPSTLMSAALRLHAGGSFGLRRLTYDVTGAGGPPPVATGAAGARVEGELYPLAFSDPKSAAAGFGIVGEYDMTLGLGIRAPGTTTDVKIDQGHYSIGARYRVGVGDSSFSFGASYARQRYIADRSAAQLDMPDVDYAAIAPGVAVRVLAASSVSVFASADLLLLFATGPIQTKDSYGAANVIGGALDAGVDIALGSQLALRLAAEYSQINFSFKKTTGNRGVTGATDRGFGLATTLVVMY